MKVPDKHNNWTQTFI